MPVFTTEGVIVKRSNFGEADRILTILTPFKGKITVLARGVRKITSRRGGNVELLNKVRLQIYKGQGLAVLSEAESLETFPKIKSDLILSSYGVHVAELVNRLIPEEQLNPGVYKLFLEILTLLEENPRQIFVRAFEVKLLSSLGFWSLDQIGGLDGREGIREILEGLEKGTWQDVTEINLTKGQALELERVLRYYIEGVLEASLKSLKIIEKLKGDR